MTPDLTLRDLRAMTPEEREQVPCNSCSGRLERAAKVFLCRWCRSQFTLWMGERARDDRLSFNKLMRP